MFLGADARSSGNRLNSFFAGSYQALQVLSSINELITRWATISSEESVNIRDITKVVIVTWQPHSVE